MLYVMHTVNQTDKPCLPPPMAHTLCPMLFHVVPSCLEQSIVLISATVENMAMLHIMPTNNELFVVALVLIMLGLTGVGVSRRTSDLGKLNKLGHQLPIAINANNPSDNRMDDPSTNLSNDLSGDPSDTPPAMLARPLLQGEGDEQDDHDDHHDPRAHEPERLLQVRVWVWV